ncbi:MAG TPA: hypothetical protein VEV20_04700, partial [Burkholderiales bacterium]|nr:hypothetical protein [Burkholderiales bacterium]
LLDAMANGELAGRVAFLSNIQGRPDAALAVADEIDAALYHGSNSQIMEHRMEALWQAPAGGSTPAHDAQIRQQSGELAKKVLSWDSAQSSATGYALEVDSRVGARAITGLPGPNGQPVSADSSMFDFPRRSVWAWHAANTAREPLLFRALTRDACRLSVGDFYWCEYYLDKLKVSVPEPEYRKEIAALVEPRFAGSASRATLLAGLKQQDGDLAGAEQLLASAIAAGTHQKDLYSALGYLQLNDARYAQAAETFLAFAGLKQSVDNTVGLSNYLEEPAYAFSTRGALPQASQLFKIVASHRDGSFANLSGAMQYALLEGRYELARDILREQYQHYHDWRSARRLASLLFMMGESENGWSVLKMAQTDGDPSNAALVGLRVAGADADRIAAWTAAQADTDKAYSRPMWQALELMSEDRPASVLRQIYEVDAKARKLTKGTVVRDPVLEPKNAALLAKSYLPEPAFVEGYAAVKERKYPEALSILEPLFTGPEERHGNGSPKERAWQLFPYVALATARTAGGDKALDLIQRVKASGKPRNVSAAAVAAAAEPIRPFYLNLALAVGDAFKGDHARAEAEVQKARAGINGIDGFLAPGYELVEILERLSEETRHPAYIAIALEYARAYQRYEPWQAWPYAFEARHAPPGPARIRAAAIALKLDPQSQWLHELDVQTMEQARQWAKANRWPAKDSPSQPAKWDQARSWDRSRPLYRTDDTLLHYDARPVS